MKVKLAIKADELRRKLRVKDGTPGKRGKDGETPSDARLKKLIQPLIPEPVPGSPDTGEEIIKKVNADESDALIRKEKVEGLEKLEIMVRTADANVRGFANSGSFSYNKDISSLLDGVTKTFTIAPNARVLLVISSSFPTVFQATTDYTVAGGVLTFAAGVNAASMLAAGQVINVLYTLP